MIDHFFRFYLFIYLFFRDRGREGEKGEKHQRAIETSIGCLSHPPNWDLAHNPGMSPDWEWNR